MIRTGMRLALGCAAALILAGTASAQNPKVERGQAVYAEQKCSLCHSIADKGNKKGPLDGVADRLTADELCKWVTDARGMTEKSKAPRKPAMKDYVIPAADLDALVAYLGTLKK